MTKVKMTALDTFHITGVRAEPLFAGDEFEVSEAEGKKLADYGLAKRAPGGVKTKAN
jgi:hypothetical protein